MIYIKFGPQKCGTFILVPHVPQMWHKCGTQKRAHTFFRSTVLGAPKVGRFYVSAPSAPNGALVGHQKGGLTPCVCVSMCLCVCVCTSCTSLLSSKVPSLTIPHHPPQAGLLHHMQLRPASNDLEWPRMTSSDLKRSVTPKANMNPTYLPLEVSKSI